MSENDMFYCSFVSIHYIICECGETFPTEDALRGHLDKEHPHKKERKEYKCGVCESIFPTEQECIEHYEESHIDVKEEYSEEVDEESQDVKDIVEVEMEEVGEMEKPMIRKKKKHYERTIVCEVCGKRYASNAALKYHQRVHTGERPYHCTMCPKSFTMPLFLQIHLRTHTGERPYECQICPKAFSNKAALLRHDRVHTGIKPYGCPQCGKFFTQSNSMKLHVNTVHLKMPAPYKSKNRKLKALEREMMGSKMKTIYQVIENKNSKKSRVIEVVPDNSQSETEAGVRIEAGVESKVEFDNEAELESVKDEVEMYEEVAESEILYDHDIDEKEITYEVIYQD